jgi:hypothetical protein
MGTFIDGASPGMVPISTDRRCLDRCFRSSEVDPAEPSSASKIPLWECRHSAMGVGMCLRCKRGPYHGMIIVAGPVRCGHISGCYVSVPKLIMPRSA